MIDKYFGGKLPNDFELTAFGLEISKFVTGTAADVQKLMDDLRLNDAAAKTWDIISRMNKFIDETEPWKLFKDAAKHLDLAGYLYILAETLRIVSILIYPIMPNTSPLIREQLGVSGKLEWDGAKTFGLLEKSVAIKKAPPLFPRIDIEKELVELDKISESLSNVN
jgi:methionyl-tRNA synthetase